MNNSIKKLIEDVLYKTCKESGISREHLPPIFINQPKKKEWGDLSTNLPFSLSQKTGKSASHIGKLLTSSLEDEKLFSRVEFIPPGFINFFISSLYLKQTLKKILIQKEEFTQFSSGKSKKVQIEFVSANPTGPLHIGHGRAAAFGDSLANILSKVGYEVEREYYVNDVGGQIKRLFSSVWARLKELEGEKVSFPQDGYKGEYLIEIAKKAKKELGSKLSEIAKGVDLEKEIAKEEKINQITEGFSSEKKMAQKKREEKAESQILGLLGRFAVNEILKEIKVDLKAFGVRFDSWISESSLHQKKAIPEVLSYLQEKNYLYEKDGALWFKTSLFLPGEEDRVLRRRNGDYTYFASDIAYHQDKLSRRFDRVIDIWGADHIGYVPRIKAAIQALGYPEKTLQVIIYQLVTLKRGKKRISASTREGKFIPLKEVLDEVGRDAARFFFLSRTRGSHLDFDLELAKKQTPENPVFYVQYAHARICSILENARENRIKINNPDEVKLDLLTTPEERELMKELSLLPDEVYEAAESLEPHRLTTYLQELATLFHQFYTRHRVISEDRKLTQARLMLVKAIKVTIGDVLGLLGISVPQKM